MKKYLVGAGASAFLLVVLGWLGSCSPPWSEAEAKALRAVSDSLANVVREDSIATAALISRNDSLLAVVDSTTAVADSADARADREALRASQTASRLRRLLTDTGGDTTSPDAAVALLDTLEAQHAVALEQKDVAIAELRTNVDRLRGLNADLALQLVKVQSDASSAVVALEADRDFWQAAAEDQVGGLSVFGLFKVPEWVGYVAVAGGGIYLGTQLAR